MGERRDDLGAQRAPVVERPGRRGPLGRSRPARVGRQIQVDCLRARLANRLMQRVDVRDVQTLSRTLSGKKRVEKAVAGSGSPNSGFDFSNAKRPLCF